MSVAFLHGVETVETEIGPQPISVVKSSVIALIGSAPSGPVNELTLVSGVSDAAQFGKKIAGFNIPHALDAIFKQGAGTVLVVNVADTTNSSFLTTVTSESMTTANWSCKTAFVPMNVANSAVVVKNSSGSTTYVKDTDYTIDDLGNITILNSALVDGTVLKATYKKFNTAGVTNVLLVGGVDGTTGVKTGLSLYLDSYATFGFKPKIFIAPSYVEDADFATDLLVAANSYKGIALIDAPVGTTVANAIKGRGPSGSINFFTGDKRAYLLYPHLQVANEVTGVTESQPYSQFMAGVMAATDNAEGYWVSPSNKIINGILGTEIPISFDLTDANCQANQLNAAGITTIAAGFGTGYRTWGNRSAAFPVSTAPGESFICVRRMFDVMEESVAYAMMDYIDEPLTPANIDVIRESENSFFATLVQRGALIDGTLLFDPVKNPPAQLAAGQIEFDIDAMSPTPMERATFNVFIDTALLANLVTPSTN